MSTRGAGAESTSCVIGECRDPVDPQKVVEMSIPERPYKMLRHACPRHLEMFRSIGLPVIPPPGAAPNPA